MQYVLNEEEYKSLVERAEIGDKAISVEKLQELCTFAANNIPIDVYFNEDEKEPWGGGGAFLLRTKNGIVTIALFSSFAQINTRSGVNDPPNLHFHNNRHTYINTLWTIFSQI